MKNLKKPLIILVSVLLVVSLCANIYLGVQLNTANATISTNVAKQESDEKKIDEQQKTIDDLTAKIEGLENKIDSLIAEIEALKTENDLLKKELVELKAKAVIDAKPVEVKKPEPPKTNTGTSSQPSKPAKAPVYINLWGTEHLCNGVKGNPPSLPPTDGDRWTWAIIQQEWMWNDTRSADYKGGCVGEVEERDYVLGERPTSGISWG